MLSLILTLAFGLSCGIAFGLLLAFVDCLSLHLSCLSLPANDEAFGAKLSLFGISSGINSRSFRLCVSPFASFFCFRFLGLLFESHLLLIPELARVFSGLIKISADSKHDDDCNQQEFQYARGSGFLFNGAVSNNASAG